MSHCSRDLFDVVRLVRARHRNSSDSWQVHQSEVWAGVRVHGQDNWLVDDVLAFAANLVCQEVYRLFHLAEVSELLVRYLIELCPRLYVLWRMIQTQLERTSCHNSITSGEKV